MLRAFREAGYGDDARLVSINSTFNLQAPTFGTNGAGMVRNESGLVAAYTYAAAGAPVQWDSSGRFWHSNSTDTAYLEWESKDENYVGRVLTCINAPDSAHRAVSGIEACDKDTVAVALTGLKSFTTFVLNTMPGLLPRGGP